MSNIQIKGVLYQSKSAKKMGNSTTPRGRDASNGSGFSPTHNRSSQNLQNDNNKWTQNTPGVMQNQQHLAPVQNIQQQLSTSGNSSFNQEFNQSNVQQQSQQQYFVNQQQLQNQQISSRQVFNQAQYINSIINRSRSPLNKSQSQQQSGISPSSRSANKYSNIAQLITPSKNQRLATESSAQSSNNPRYQVAKSPRQQNNTNSNNQSVNISYGAGMGGQNQNNNNNQSLYNMVLNDEIMNNRQSYQNSNQLRKLNQQSNSYHNLQQYLQANNSSYSQVSTQNNNLNNVNSSNGNINNVSINNQGMSNNNQYLNPNNNNSSNNSMIAPQNNNNISSYLIQPQLSSEKNSTSSSNRFSGGDSQTKNQSHQVGSQQNLNNISPFLNRAENSNTRSSGIKLNQVKQMSSNSNMNNISIQKTNFTMHSNCTNCIEFEKELELLKSIIKSCSKCQHSYLSNSSNTSHPNQNTDSQEKMVMLDPENNLDSNNFNGNNNAQYVLEKINNMRLQEQVQQLMRQLDQVKIERDQLSYGQFNQSQEIIEKIQRYESQIKMLSQSHAKIEQKLGNYNILKSKVQDFLNSFVTSQQSPDKSNNKELIQECQYIKDFITNQQSQINNLNQRQLITAKTSLPNNSSVYTQNSSNVHSFHPQDNIKTNIIGELINQQLVLEEREQISNQYQTLPSAIKALEIAHRIKVIAQQNPFLPNQQ